MKINWAKLANIAFHEAEYLAYIHGAKKQIIEIIKSQPGYKKGSRMKIMKSMAGGFRLYAAEYGIYKDASLMDLPEE